MTRGRVVVGMAGWVYPAWRGGFYPKGTRQADELEYASSHVTSIELNGSFYAVPKAPSWISWRDRTPNDFVFSVKAPRFITYVKQLAGVDAALDEFFGSGIVTLGAKLGAILWQLPPYLAFDPVLLEGFLARLPRTADDGSALRHALEVRNESYLSPQLPALLRRHGVAAVYGDTTKYPVIDDDTAGFRYARLHGDTALYPGGYYEPADLDRWADRIEGWRESGADCYVYFTNDTKTRAPIDAMSLIERLQP